MTDKNIDLEVQVAITFTDEDYNNLLAIIDKLEGTGLDTTDILAHIEQQVCDKRDAIING